jgi:hypothetical protein
MTKSKSLTFRQASALIRHQVREKLLSDVNRDIWQTQYFIERINLASTAYGYLDARLQDNTPAPIELLIDVVIEEFRDFVLVQDVGNNITVVPILHCQSCNSTFTANSVTQCPKCGYPSFFQTTQFELDDIQSSLNLDSNDPIARRFLSSTERIRLENGYQKLVSCFEAFHRNVSVYAFDQAGKSLKELSKKTQFQNLSKTKDWFKNHYNYELFGILNNDGMQTLNLVFQKRHLLAHKRGIIDDDYIRNTGEPEDLKGNFVRIDKVEIIDAVQLVKRVIEAERKHFAPRFASD